MKTSLINESKQSKQRTRYGKSLQLNQQKLSTSFFQSSHLNRNKFQTIGQPNSATQFIDTLNFTEDSKINSLIVKNDRLKAEIKKIDQVLNEVTELEKVKPEYGIKLPQIRNQVADKQLENAYKQIKHYQFQIQKLQSLQNQGTYAVRLTKAQRTLKQKQQIKNKLKIQLEKTQKSSKNISKSLTDDKTKILFQNKSKKLNDQLKMYEKKWDQDEKKKNFFLQTQKKKRNYILQLQQKIKKSGVETSQVEDIRRKIFQAPKKDQQPDNSEELQVEDRSPQAYKAILNEIKLLRKVNVTNDKLLEKMSSQKEDYTEKNKKTKIKLDEAQKEIQIIENQIVFLKKHVDPQKLKPHIKIQNPLNSQLTFNSNAASYTITDENISNDPFPNKNKNILQHHFEFVEIGTLTKRSEKFNDRKLLGKRSAKIIAVELYENRMQLLGFRFSYFLKQGQKIQGLPMQIKNQNQRHLQKKQLTLEDKDYIVSIQCFISPKKYIVGMILISQTGKVLKGGFLQGQKRFLEMNPKQYPGCVYSCIVKEGIQLIGVQKVQPQSF